MTSYQTQLIEELSAKKIEAKFNGDFLNCKVAITSGSKIKWQKFSFVFDSADDCQGSRLFGKMRGAYCEIYAEKASDIITAHSTAIAEEVIA